MILYAAISPANLPLLFLCPHCKSELTVYVPGGIEAWKVMLGSSWARPKPEVDGVRCGAENCEGACIPTTAEEESEPCGPE